jgi:hypothetical protein
LQSSIEMSTAASSDRPVTPNPAVDTDARRRGFARAAVTGYLVS